MGNYHSPQLSGGSQPAASGNGILDVNLATGIPPPGILSSGVSSTTNFMGVLPRTGIQDNPNWLPGSSHQAALGQQTVPGPSLVGHPLAPAPMTVLVDDNGIKSATKKR